MHSSSLPPSRCSSCWRSRRRSERDGHRRLPFAVQNLPQCVKKAKCCRRCIRPFVRPSNRSSLQSASATMTEIDKEVLPLIFLMRRFKPLCLERERFTDEDVMLVRQCTQELLGRRLNKSPRPPSASSGWPPLTKSRPIVVCGHDDEAVPTRTTQLNDIGSSSKIRPARLKQEIRFELKRPIWGRPRLLPNCHQVLEGKKR
jgi:hypothetical protein